MWRVIIWRQFIKNRSSLKAHPMFGVSTISKHCFEAAFIAVNTAMNHLVRPHQSSGSYALPSVCVLPPHERNAQITCPIDAGRMKVVCKAITRVTHTGCWAASVHSLDTTGRHGDVKLAVSQCRRIVLFDKLQPLLLRQQMPKMFCQIAPQLHPHLSVTDAVFERRRVGHHLRVFHRPVQIMQLAVWYASALAQ